MITNTVLLNYLDGNKLVSKTAVNKVRFIKLPNSVISDVIICKKRVEKTLKITVTNNFVKPIYNVSLYKCENKKNNDADNIKVLLPGEKGKFIYHIDCEALCFKVCVQYTVDLDKEKNKIYRII